MLVNRCPHYYTNHTIMENSNNRSCLQCGKVVKGRSDKKFCDDYCRNIYNNQLKAPPSKVIKTINGALGKNRRILEEMCNGASVVKTNRNKLLQKGFQFKYSTHTYTNKKGNVYYFCYDLGYLFLENDALLLVRGKEENAG